ncbi:MAG TPA: hypothetical protein VIG99_14620 [Myxococcaceae bacterium]|jgi:hypothetical protein
MNVKGISHLARQDLIVEEFGEVRWRDFMNGWLQSHPGFPAQILPITKLPLEPYLQLQEAVLREFYSGDRMAWWHIGIKSAAVALTTGQLKGLFRPGETRRFLLFMPNVFRGYFDGGELTVASKGDAVEVAITGVPPHLYFEYGVMGFVQGGMQLLDPKSQPGKRVRGFSIGDPDVLYAFKG